MNKCGGILWRTFLTQIELDFMQNALPGIIQQQFSWINTATSPTNLVALNIFHPYWKSIHLNPEVKSTEL